MANLLFLHDFIERFETSTSGARALTFFELHVKKADVSFCSRASFVVSGFPIPLIRSTKGLTMSHISSAGHGGIAIFD